MPHGERARNQNHRNQEQRAGQFRLQPDLVAARREACLLQLADKGGQLIDGNGPLLAKAVADPVQRKGGGNDKRLVALRIAFGVDAYRQRP